MSDETVRPGQPRWGVRALLFLTFAFLSVLTSNALLMRDVDDYVVFTFLATIGGLAGAAYCSYRGLKTAGWLTRR